MKSFRKKEKRGPDDPFDQCDVFGPKDIFDRMRTISRERMIPLSRLFIYAARNELDCEIPFNFDCSTKPKNRDYDESGHMQKMLHYIAKFPAGIGLDMLVAARDSIGIYNKDEVVWTYNTLLELELIKEEFPKYLRFRYAPDYKVVTIVDELAVQMPGKRIKKEVDPRRNLIIADVVGKGALSAFKNKK